MSISDDRSTKPAPSPPTPAPPSEPPEESEAKSTPKQNSKPITLSSIKESVRGVPSKASSAINEGKGNTVIERLQKLLADAICSVPSSCRLLILNQLLLSANDKGKISRSCMFIGAILFLVFLALGIITKDSIKLVEALLCIVAVICANIFVTKTGISDRSIKKAKSKKAAKTKQNDDIIL